jgi:hypothetical protein
MPRGLTLFLNADPNGPALLVDPEQVADLAAGLDNGVGGLYAARKAKLPLYRSVGAGEHVEPSLIAVEDAHELVATFRVETTKDKETRNRFQRYLDSRRAARRARAEELGRREKERELAEELAIKQGLHADFLADQARAAAAQAEYRRRYPDAPDNDLDLSAWQESGEPEVVSLPTPPAPDYISNDEGEVLR